MPDFLDKICKGSRKILITGHFGSGKTEFAVSLAFALAKKLQASKESMAQLRLALVDLDIENPYFRSRERKEELEAAGVPVYSDPYGGKNGSELQVISAQVFAPIQDENCRVIVDCGGDQSGARILNQISRYFRDEYQLLSVVNCNRPGTDTVEKAIKQIQDVQEETALCVTGLISNAHMIRYTMAEDVIEGWSFTKKVAQKAGLEALAACAMDSVADELEKRKAANDPAVSDMDIFRVGLYMRDSYLDKQV